MFRNRVSLLRVSCGHGDLHGGSSILGIPPRYERTHGYRDSTDGSSARCSAGSGEGSVACSGSSGGGQEEAEKGLDE